MSSPKIPYVGTDFIPYTKPVPKAKDLLGDDAETTEKADQNGGEKKETKGGKGGENGFKEEGVKEEQGVHEEHAAKHEEVKKPE